MQIAFVLISALLQGCAAEPQPSTLQQHERLFASDLQGSARSCTASKLKPNDGRTMTTTMQVGNDGGWCSITFAQSSNPYDVGLLTQAPQHGTVYIHPVGDDIRVDYTPEVDFSGTDMFVIKLLPGNPSVRVNVIVAPE
jgi:hypothetical protein